MTAFAEAFEVAQKLGSAGFVVLLVLIGYGGYKKIWVWGHQLEQCRLDCQKERDKQRQDHKDRLVDQVAETNEWRSLALRNLAIVKTMVEGRNGDA